jgi:excisionase family DNA binding protein
MGMDRIRQRLAAGQPPLGVSELADLVGCSRSYIHKLIDAGALDVGRVGRSFRVPLQEAVRIARDVGALRG